MADLRACFESLGYGDVKTLLNSGNVVFSAPAAGAGKAAARIEKTVESKHGLKSRVTVLTGAEVDAIVKENPFGKVANHPSRFFVTVLHDPADRAKLKPLQSRKWSPEAFVVGKRVAYCWCPPGLLESPLMARGRANPQGRRHHTQLGDDAETPRSPDRQLLTPRLANR